MRRILVRRLALCCIWLACAAHAATDAHADHPLRVLVIDDKQSVYLKIDDRYTITGPGRKQIMMRGWELSTRMRVSPTGFHIGSKSLPGQSIMIHTEEKYDTAVDNRCFRGDIEFIRKPDGRMMVINHIGLEEYLYGVLCHEVSPSWPMECLKAQAIAARTFALYQARMNKQKTFDLRSDVYSQVYGGKNFEHLATTTAVRETEGQVLAYKGEIFPAYFHANCGGATEDATNLWGIDIPPLDGAVCSFCKDTKHYQWRRLLPTGHVALVLRQKGYKIDAIRSCKVVARNRSSRVEKIVFRDDAGSTVVMSGKDFRQLFGPNVVRSTRFNASVRGETLILDGFGWGHGVGMCQWGAYGMAMRGKTAADILKLYYPGADIVPMSSIAESRSL